MAEKISTLVLKVDLNCPECCKKIKKTLYRYSCLIRSQVIDKKANTVTISGPFDPKCFSKKLCCKAGKAIISIEIIENKPPAPKPDPPKPPASKAPEPAPKAPEPAQKASEPAPKKPEPAPKEPEPAPKKPEPAPAPKKPEPPKEPEPVHVPIVFEPKGPVHVPFLFEPVTGYPPPNFGVCCGQCYHGQGGGPCQHGYGRPTPPPPGPTCYDAYQSLPQPCYDGYGHGHGRSKCYVPCDYFSEENSAGCTIM